MFDPVNVSRLSIPRWEVVYRVELMPGVVSLIAIHDITRGWALGGCRMARYSNEALALTDVLRLSRGMTFKNAIADLPLGGGKSIIICDPKVSGDEREKVLGEFGKFVAWVNSEEDRYYTAEDMNTTVADMHIVKKHTKNIFGTTVDPSPYTAWGVFSGIRFSVDYFAADLFDGKAGLEGKRVLVQGLGKVGKGLLDYLAEQGAELYVCDIHESKIEEALAVHPGARVVNADEIDHLEADVFAPCARGEVVDKKNVDSLKFKIICGAANNQLQTSKIGHRLQARGVVYCPDYVANMGGVCSIQYLEIEKLGREITLQNIENTVRKMLGLTFRAAFRNNLAFGEAVDHVVKKIVWGARIQNKDFREQASIPISGYIRADRSSLNPTGIGLPPIFILWASAFCASPFGFGWTRLFA